MKRATAEKYRLKDDDKITVCAACKRACCWLGVFYCDDYMSADLMTITVRELRELNLEHSDYWVQLRKAEGIHE